MIRYPIGIQTFSEIVEKGYAYVDKTGYIPELLDHGKYIFLSRPRRFGKSLLLSTLEAFFKGRRELFKGLQLASMNTEWISYPVLHIDLNAEDYSRNDGLELMLDGYLRDFEEIYGSRPEDVTISQRFKHVIKSAYQKTGQQVVILVDEYDKPLLAIDEDSQRFEANQRILKSFFGNLKTMDPYIKFTFITGVARFNKVSIFSDLNNLDDISLEDRFADICGWTETELTDSFQSGIEDLAEKRRESPAITLKMLGTYYDGYKFTPDGSRLYNPFSVLRALKARKIEPFWFETGSPTFLVRRVKEKGTYPPDLNGVSCSGDELTSVGINDGNAAPLMFQTGYLTIDSYNAELNRYQLRLPNREVEIGFYKNLLPLYAPEIKDSYSPFSFGRFNEDLYEGRPEQFMKRLAALLKDLPGEDHQESTYRAITYLLTVLCGTMTLAEHHGYRGRSDIEVQTGKYIYLFEFKYNKSLQVAWQQIESRDYAGRFAMHDNPVFLIAANFNGSKEARGLEYEIKGYRP